MMPDSVTLNQTWTFDLTTVSQSWTVPEGVTEIAVDVGGWAYINYGDVGVTATDQTKPVPFPGLPYTLRVVPGKALAMAIGASGTPTRMWLTAVA